MAGLRSIGNSCGCCSTSGNICGPDGNPEFAGVYDWDVSVPYPSAVQSTANYRGGIQPFSDYALGLSELEWYPIWIASPDLSDVHTRVDVFFNRPFPIESYSYSAMKFKMLIGHASLNLVFANSLTHNGGIGSTIPGEPSTGAYWVKNETIRAWVTVENPGSPPSTHTFLELNLTQYQNAPTDPIPPWVYAQANGEWKLDYDFDRSEVTLTLPYFDSWSKLIPEIQDDYPASSPELRCFIGSQCAAASRYAGAPSTPNLAWISPAPNSWILYNDNHGPNPPA